MSTNAPSASLSTDAKIIGWVGTAHGLSHFFQMMLPPLFPLLKQELGLSYAQLGLIVGVFFAVSGLMQTAAGFAVDRYGPRAALVFGLVFTSLGLLVTAAAPGYPVMLVGAVIGGIGNAMFHPADMALLNAKITPARLGHAFSLHNIGGFSGFIVGPIFVAAVSAFAGWRGAIAAGGAIGLVFTVLMLRESSLLTERIARPAQTSAASDLGLLVSTPILACFAYFGLQAIATSGFLAFAPTAAAKLYDLPLVAAAAILTAFFAGSLAGTIAGGFGAARTTRHGTMAAVSIGAAALALALIATAWLPFVLAAVASAAFGFGVGFANPSRDILVREIAPPHARGKVYGFVYAGMDAGAAFAPVPLGWLLDRGVPSAVFASGAASLAVAILMLVLLRGRSRVTQTVGA